MEKQPAWSQRLKYERIRRGWSQEKLAKKIGSSAKTITRWERGLHRPTPELKQQLAQVFETSIEALGLLSSDQGTPSQLEEESDLSRESKEDWGEAPRRQQIYGRERELALMEDWISKDGCQILALVGMGGAGKTTLAIELTMRARSTFAFLFWRSLKNAPPLKRILEECIEFLTRQQPDLARSQSPRAEEDLLTSLLTLLRRQRCLLILDNFESVIQPKTFAGLYREGYEGYGEFLRRIGESEQSGCLILTSREKPKELLQLINDRSIHALSLGGLNEEAGNHLLKAEQLSGMDADRKKLVQRFSGNPLALKLIAESIRELFGNEITTFLTEGEAVFGGVQHLLEQQFERLSVLEQELLYGLTIEREAISSHDLQRNLAHFVSRAKVIEALESLHHRSLIETGNRAGYFTLQPVIMEYLTGRLIEHVCYEIMQEEAESDTAFSAGELPWHLISLPLVKAEGKDYLRNTQLLLIIEPIMTQVRATYGEAMLLTRLRALLDILRTFHHQHPGYLAGNILNLLIAMQIDLRGFNFSQLCIRQVDLRGVALPGVDFSEADFLNSIFNDTFSTIFCVTFSPDGSLLAASTSSGEIRLWLARNAVPLLTCRGHSHWIRSLAFRFDSSLLVSGGGDRVLRIWDVHNGRCLMMLEGHTAPIRSVTFSPDGETIASGSEDGTIRLWKTRDGTCLNLLKGHRGWVRSVAFSPGGELLASGGEDQTVRLWNWSSGQNLGVFHGHGAQVRAVTFSPDGVRLASAGDDRAVRIWDIRFGQNLRTLRGHYGHVMALDFDRNGDLIASGGSDNTARIWNVHSGELLFTLHGHTNRVSSLAFAPDTQNLVTVGEDQTMRLWEVHTGRCIKTLLGHTSLVKSLAFSPDGRFLAEGRDDCLVRIWDISLRSCSRTLRGHTHRVWTVAFSPDGNLLASGSEDNTVRVWEKSRGQCLHILRGHTYLIRSLAFNNDGSLLASASYDHTIRLWSTQDGHCRAILRGHSGVVWNVAFSQENQLLVSSGKDQEIRLWDSQSGECVEKLYGSQQRVREIFLGQGTKTILTGSSDNQRICVRNIRNQDEIWLVGHTGAVRTLGFHRSGKIVASGGEDQTLRLWDMETRECRVLHQESEISSIAFSPDEEIVAGGDKHGSLYLWNIRTSKQLTTLRSEQLYEKMNISGTRGLSESQREALLALGAIEQDYTHQR